MSNDKFIYIHGKWDNQAGVKYKHKAFHKLMPWTPDSEL